MRFGFWSREYVRHLEGEIDWLKTQWAKSNQRADIAVAELVRLKTDGQASVHPQPLLPDAAPADLATELADLRRDPEWAQAGV